MFGSKVIKRLYSFIEEDRKEYRKLMHNLQERITTLEQLPSNVPKTKLESLLEIQGCVNIDEVVDEMNKSQVEAYTFGETK